MSPPLRHIYVIEIRDPWIDVVARGVPTNGRRCFYVGETAKPIAERVAEHLAGSVRVAGCFKAARRAKAGSPNWQGTPRIRGTDVWLRTKLFNKLPGVADSALSEAQEGRVADELRRAGHIVFPKHAGSTPFR